MRNTLLSGVAAFAVLVAAGATAQGVGSPRTRAYIDAMGQSDAFEMFEADTALAQSNDGQVRAFAQRMLEDHGRLSQAMRQAAARARLMPPPMGLGADQAPLLATLQNLRGPDFDRAFWRHQALAHRSALTTAQLYISTGDDPVIREAAASAVPVIAAHLAMAERMQAGSGS